MSQEAKNEANFNKHVERGYKQKVDSFFDQAAPNIFMNKLSMLPVEFAF